MITEYQYLTNQLADAAKEVNKARLTVTDTEKELTNALEGILEYCVTLEAKLARAEVDKETAVAQAIKDTDRKWEIRTYQHPEDRPGI